MRDLWVLIGFLVVLSAAYIVPYTILKLKELAWLAYPFWCIDTLIAIALMFYVMSKWRD